MRPREPFAVPLKVTAVAEEIVFVGQVSFSMTREAARVTLLNLARVLQLSEISPSRNDAAVVVLIVEDEPLTREVSATILEDAGYQVIRAEGSGQALEALEAGGAIHLVFTDINMPGDLDGMQLAVLVRDRWPAIHLLVTSAQLPLSLDALPSGGRFMSKPYQETEMLRHVSELVDA